MNYYDRILRENVEQIILPLAHKILGIQIQSSQEIPTDLILTLERRPDYVHQITTPEHQNCILHLEFQVKDEAEMVKRMQTYKAHLQHLYLLPVLQFVIYLGQKPPEMATKLSELIPQETSNYAFTLIDLQTFSYESLLTSEIPEEILLAILGNFGQEAPKAVIQKIIRNLQKAAKDSIKLQKYLHQLNILSRLRKLEDTTIQIIENMPIEYNIKEDYLYKKGEELGLEKGQEIGEKLGLEKGQEIGEKLGLEKGQEIGREEGEKLGLEKGQEIGEKLGLEKIVAQMLTLGKYKVEEIALITQIDVQRVKEIQRKLDRK